MTIYERLAGDPDEKAGRRAGYRFGQRARLSASAPKIPARKSLSGVRCVTTDRGADRLLTDDISISWPA